MSKKIIVLEESLSISIKQLIVTVKGGRNVGKTAKNYKGVRRLEWSMTNNDKCFVRAGLFDDVDHTFIY